MTLSRYTPKRTLFTKCGLEFGDRAGEISIVERALYGLTTSVEHFRIILADFLRTLYFVLSRFGRDVWMILRDEKSGYY